VSKSLTVVSAAWAVPDAGSDTYSTTTPVSIDISPVITVSFDP
jgi:hypothetical protein